MSARLCKAALFLLGALAAGLPPRASAEPAPDGPHWTWDAAVGFDSFTHTYALATADTSETVSEIRAQLGLEGRSKAGVRDVWRLRLEGSAGSDLWRERLDADWRRVDRGGVTRARFGLRCAGRQYRSGTDYGRSSDQGDGRFDAQAVPLARAGGELYVLGWAAATAFTRSSPLEQDLRELGIGAGVRSRGGGEDVWRLTLRHATRTYPDSTIIDRRSWSAEAEGAKVLDGGGSTRFYGRSERRSTADPGVRPDAWLHWLDVAATVPVLGSELVFEAQAERLDYGSESATYQDSWRLGGLAGLRRGDVLGLQWLLGLAGERFSTASAAESYAQAGVRAGLESYGTKLTASCSIEHGRRDHGDPAPDDASLSWSDFNYWRLWLLAEYRLAAQLSLSGLGSWEPESHVEPTDDVALGFASLRLVWRP